MFLFVLLLGTFSKRHKSRSRKRRSSKNQEVALEFLSADSGDLKGVRLGPSPRFRRYRTARFLEQLLRRVKYEKNLARQIEKEGASGMEKLMREMLGPLRPYAEMAAKSKKEWEPIKEKYAEEMKGIFDKYVNNPYFTLGVPIVKDAASSV